MCETTNENEVAQKFETETCSRCGGSGNYSYCQTYGTTCFKCAGRKITYTKKGAAAAKFYEDSCMLPTSELRVGMSIRCGGVTMGGGVYNYFGKITSISQSSTKFLCNSTQEWVSYIDITTERKSKSGKVESSTYSTFADTLHRVAQTAEQKKEKLAAAYAYQATLTKAGKPRKSK